MMITLLLFKVIGFKGNRCQSIGNMSTTCFFVVPCLVKKQISMMGHTMGNGQPAHLFKSIDQRHIFWERQVCLNNGYPKIV
jgi:hypothetical protein